MKYNINIDLNSLSGKRDGTKISQLFPPELLLYHVRADLLLLDVHPIVNSVEGEFSHCIKLSKVHDDIRFEIQDISNTITGLSLLMNDVIQYLHCNSQEMLIKDKKKHL